MRKECVSQTDEFIMLTGGQILGKISMVHMDDFCTDEDQHGLVRSIRVAINSDVADFGRECMSTRFNSSHLFSPLRDPECLIRRRNLGEPSFLFDFEEVMNINHNQEPPPQNGPPPMVRPNGQAPRRMEQLCQPFINGRGGPITPILIQATDFGLRHHMIQQVQNTCQFHGLPGDDANRHIDKFLEFTQHMKQNGVSDNALRLSPFPYSLTHHVIAPNGKLIHNSIINGPYVRRMIPEPGDTNREVPVNETFHVQTEDELTEKELKQIEADNQAIQTILLGLPEDIYAAVDSCETAQEIWLRVQQMMKGSDIGIQEKKAKLFNEWERFTSNEGESIESYYHPPHQDQPSFNQNYMQQPMPNPEDITDPTTAMNMALELMAKAFKLNYSTPTSNNQRISSNPRNRQIAQPGMNMGQDRLMQMVGVQNPSVQNIGNQNGLIGVQGNGNQNQIGNGNLVAARAEGNAAGQNGNQIRCYNCRGACHFARNFTVRPKRRDAAYLQTQLLIAQKEEAGLELQAEEFDLMAAAADLDEIEKVNANCILMANLQQASTSGTQFDKALVYDSDGSAEVHDYENCDDNEIFNMFTQEEQYTEILEHKPDQHQVPQNDNNVIFEEKSTVSFLLEEKKKLKSNFKTCKDELLDKQIQLEKGIKELNNILVKTGQSIQTIHMLSPKPDSFYHLEQKMALGYQNPFYLKQAQKKQQSLYDGKVLLEKHDPPVVHDSEETLQLAQESHEKMKQLNKEIKPENYTKINHLSGTIVTLQRVIKHRMTLETPNWSSYAHQELYKFVKDKNFPIVNQVEARVQNFEIQFLKEAAKFVGDFKPLAKEANESLAKHKALELEIKRLLRAVVSQDITSVVQKESVVDISDLQTELERTKECFENCIIKKENEYAKLWNDWYKKCDECKYDKIS
nr:ribonuclease H-like domain-containing protein [Tanacetum cinerariifolium]